MKHAAVDTSISVPAMTSPFWLQHLEFWLQHFVVLGASILLILRIVLALRELRAKDKEEGARNV